MMLMPPSVAEWLPEDDLAWFVLDVVDELDLSAFLAGYRADGRGGAAYDPAMMVALLVYAYSVGERSSRNVERRCVEDVALRVVAANQVPDHATIARFRAAHEDALGGLFAQVLALCARAGVLRPGLVAIDGTKLAANASREANRTAEQLAAEILAEAEAKSYEAHMARRTEMEQATGRPIRAAGVEAFIAPGRARNLTQIADADHTRSQVLARVEAGELDKLDAAAKLGVTRARVNQLLRRSRVGARVTLTTPMMAKLDTPRGLRIYRKRAASVEPVFGQIKHNRKIRSVSRRGLTAADSEWKLITATHNLLKLWRLAPLPA